jgi:hypothetical protein
VYTDPANAPVEKLALVESIRRALLSRSCRSRAFASATLRRDRR